MTRDDALKRLMNENRPTPSPAFSGRLRQTLKKLPEHKRSSTRFALPSSAIVFVAVAAACFALVNGKALGSLFSGDTPPSTQQLAAGDLTTDAPETPAPTPEETQESNPAAQGTPIPTPADPYATAQPGDTPAPTPGQDDGTSHQAGPQQFLQPVNSTSTDNGVTVTVLEAGTDGTVLQMKIKAGPFKEQTCPNQNMKVSVNDVLNTSVTTGVVGQENSWEGEPAAGYNTYTVILPLTARITGDTARIELTDEMDLSNDSDLSIDSEEEEKALTYTHVTVKLSFDLAVYRPEKLNATGSGTVAYGNEAVLQGMYRLGDCTVFTVQLEDNADGDIDAYFEQNASKNGNTEDRVVFTPEIPKRIGIVLCNGKVAKEYLESFSCMEHINLVISAGEKLEHDFYGGNTMMLERDGALFKLIIINTWKGFIPEKDITIFTKNHYGLRNDSSEGTNGYVANFAFYVNMK